MLGSCGANESDGANESESSSSTLNVDGREVSTIKLGDLEVMAEDLGWMDWNEAKNACKNLGDGWRLPTKDELNILYEHKDKVCGFTNYDTSSTVSPLFATYWSSTEYDGFNAWLQYFNRGYQIATNKIDTNYVRAVRSINN